MNDFKLKDEDYHRDTSDDEDDEINDKRNEGEEEEEDDDVFNPLSAYKDEIEQDKMCTKKERNKEKEKLEAWRRKQEIDRKIAYINSKKKRMSLNNIKLKRKRVRV